jgi:folate-binding protein YgfZ
LRIEGPDAVKWLHKIVTADVAALRPGDGAHSALLDARGHFVGEFILLRDQKAIGALAEPEAGQTLYNNLRRYVIRERVTISDTSQNWHSLTLVGPTAASAIERVLGTPPPERTNDWVWGQRSDEQVLVVRVARARVPAFDLLVLSGAEPALRDAFGEVPELDNQVLETLRIEAGLPRWGVDVDESTLALEIPDVMQIRVDQGCYVGQEVVARIIHRGHVNRHLRGLQLAGKAVPTRGQPITHAGAQVGNVTSAAYSPTFGNIALGYVRRTVEPGTQVEVEQTPAHVIELPFSQN